MGDWNVVQLHLIEVERAERLLEHVGHLTARLETEMTIEDNLGVIIPE